jgi:hypothetical protein
MTTEHNQLHEKLKLIKEKLSEFDEYVMNLYEADHISVDAIKKRFSTAIKTVECKSSSATNSRIDCE